MVITVNELMLSKRLKTVANEIPVGSKIADIGSDHAYLPCYAILQGISSFAIAGEVNDGPYQSAKKQVNQLNLNEYIKVRKGDGLEVLNKGEVNVVTIAGMGGPLISDILDKGKEHITEVERLILQPNIGAKKIRRWLLENNWELIKEHILVEDDKIYEVLVADRGNPLKPYHQNQMESCLLLGPFLKKEKSNVFIKKWTFELNKWREILAQLDHAIANNETQKKKIELTKKIKMVEEVFQQ